MSNAVLLAMDPRQYANDGPFLNEERILSWFGLADAFWGYKDNPSPEKPHAELTSGLCSNGYFDCPQLLSYPNVAEILGRQLALCLKVSGVKRVDWVISSAYSAITFGHEVAKALGARFMNTEKDPADPKKQLWQRIVLPQGAQVLQVEELITTWGTTTAVRQAIKHGNPNAVDFLQVVGTLVLRPPDLAAMNREHPVIALVEKEIWAKRPEDCPLHVVGSIALKPKTHWAQLTGKA